MEAQKNYSQEVSSDMKNELISIRNLTKRFPGVTALNNVDFTLKKGEIHGIVGENGAGKSTFCHILTGVHSQDEGEIYFNGKKVNINHSSKALDLGIRMVYQERNLIPYLRGYENICLNSEPTNYGVLDEEASKQRVKKLKKFYNIKVDTTEVVSELSPSDKQIVEILRAIFYEPKVLILDEPTASLAFDNVESLFSIIRSLNEKGISIIYISHKLDEVFDLCDRISIFRDGSRIRTKKVENITQDKCVEIMANKKLENRYPDYKSYIKEDEDVLKLHNLSDKYGFINNINLKLRRGEILGFFGLVGSGRTELAETIFGIRKQGKGKIELGNKEITKNISTKERMEKGIFLLPEDRNELGFIPIFKLKENMSISILDRTFGPFKTINRKKEKKIVNEIIETPLLDVKYSSLNQDVLSLSGGNQQKLLIGRMLAHNADVYILDEPTKGIDVGVKFQIYKIMKEIASNGKGIIFISSELPELLGVCDRILAFKNGEIVEEFKRKNFNKENILSVCL